MMLKKWTISALVASLVAVMAGVNTTHDFFGTVRSIFTRSTVDPRFLGRWDTSWRYNLDDDSELSFKGTSEFFQNGRYNTSGIMILTALKGPSDIPIDVEYFASWAGTWAVEDSGMTTTMQEMKTVPDKLVHGTREWSAGQIEQVEQFARRVGKDVKLPVLSDHYPNGATAYAKIVSVSDQWFTLTEDAGHQQVFAVLGRRD